MDNIRKQVELEQDIKTRTSVFEIFNSGDDISIPLIQRRCKCGYNSAYRVFNNLLEDDLIMRGENKNGVSKMK